MLQQQYYRLKYRFKGRIQYWLFMIPYRWWYFASLLGIVLSTLGVAGNLHLLTALSVVPVLLGVIVFFRDILALHNAEKDVFGIALEPAEALQHMQISDTYRGYEILPFGRNRALWSASVNRLLANAPLHFKLRETKFHMNQVASSIAPFALQEAFKRGAALWNDAKVRLLSDLTLEFISSERAILLQPTDYFTGICTSEMTCREVWSKRGGHKLYDGFSLMSNNGIILDLEQSACSNEIGISTLAFSNDGYILFTVQSSESAQSPNLLAPSGSGSADLGDFERYGNAFLERAMERELLEECGLMDGASIGQWDQLVKTHLIGFARIVNRGGKPEFFGISVLRQSRSSLRVSSKEVLLVAQLEDHRIDRHDVQRLQSQIREYRENRSAALSPSLYLNLFFLEDYLWSLPRAFQDLVEWCNAA